MTFVNAYDTRTGKKLPYLVPESHIDHPVLGKRLSRLPSQKKARRAAPTPVEVDPVTTTPDAPAAGETEKE